MWRCVDIWATSCGSGNLGQRDVQEFQQHPVEVDQVIWDIVDTRHLANIQWIKLSGIAWGPITGLHPTTLGLKRE